jgi:NAD(P)-dependent dehydrogenase (short-subunit alcohol dehydrogenase family)
MELYVNKNFTPKFSRLPSGSRTTSLWYNPCAFHLHIQWGNTLGRNEIMNDLQDKIILITGGASGIGAAAVTTAAQQGARVAVVDFNIDAATAIAEETDGAKAYRADVTNPSDMDEVVAQVVADFGGLDGAINNAGIGQHKRVLTHELPEDIWARVMDVNLNGVFYSAKAELRYFAEKRAGSIVNTASLAGLRATEGMASYVASKHAVVGLTKAIALEYGPMNIRCNAICPSYVRTPLTEHGFADKGLLERVKQKHPSGRAVTAQEVADAMVFLLSDRASGISAEVFKIDCGAAAR